MSLSNEPPNLSARILTMQIIASAITLGAIIFLTIVLIMRSTGQVVKAPATPLISYIALGFAALAVVAAVAVPRLLMATLVRGVARTSAPERPEEEFFGLCNVYQTGLIQRLAILEGAAFFQILAFLLEGQQACLIVTAILLAGLVLQFPYRSRVETWIEAQRLKIQEQTAFGG
jgi:hypothetical protein